MELVKSYSWLIFEKKPFPFCREVWIQVLVILLQLYLVIFFHPSLRFEYLHVVFKIESLKKKWIRYFFCLESCRWWQPLILKSTNFHYVLITYNFIQATIWNLHHLKSQLLVFINGLEKVTKIRIQCLRAKCFLTERNMQVRFDLKVVLKFLDIEILIIRTSFHEMHTIDHMFSEHFPFSLLPKLLSDKMFFYGKWCCPSPSSTQKLRFRAFIWGIVCLYRILKKAGQNILSFWWNSVVKINYDIPLI